MSFPDRLACGAAVGPLVDQVAEGDAGRLTEHQQACVLCQAALVELDGLWMSVRAARAEHVALPDGVVAAVMRRVRAMTPGPWALSVTSGARGTTTMPREVIETVADHAAAAVGGVVLVSARSARLVSARVSDGPTDLGRTTDPAPQRVDIDVWLVTDDETPIPVVARRVRSRIARELMALTGLSVGQISVRVDAITGGRPDQGWAPMTLA